MAIVIAGERSGSGKTTVTLALLAALRRRGDRVQSFKVGPDYIDPMFHQYVTQRPCYNLDPVLTSKDYLPNCFHNRTQDVELAAIEGVMGLFDGAVDPAGYGSTAMVAKLLALPIMLVIDCRSMSQSIAALVQGYRSFDPELVMAGVVLNRVGSDRHLEILTAALEPLQVPILGVFRREDEISLPDRHLGLVPTDELPELRQIVDRLAVIGEEGFDWVKLEPLLQTHANRPVAPNSGGTGVKAPRIGGLGASQISNITSIERPMRIAIARDAAFNFYYAENLALLRSLGAELVEWSPLADQQVPEGIRGLYLGGGFPEMFAATLSENQRVSQQVRQLVQAGLPTYAECGGLMYLAEAIVDFEGKSWPMVGVIPTVAQMGKRLTLGYRSAIAQADTPTMTQGTIVRGHEFHRSTLTIAPTKPLFKMYRSVDYQLRSAQAEIQEGWFGPSFHASYLHLHWGAMPELAKRWLLRCAAWRWS